MLLLLAVAAVVTLFLSVRGGLFGRLPTLQQLSAIRNEQATLVLSREGAVIGKFFDRDRTNVTYEDLPLHLVQALIATEDRRFLEHEGVDLRSYLRVLAGILIGGRMGGGSTISQQVVKNLYGRGQYGPLTLPVNKMREAIIARRLEQVYSKEEIIILYLNSVPFGGNTYGIEAAAQHFFGKHTTELRIEEAAVLVGALKANTAYDPHLHPEASLARRNEVLRNMGTREAMPQRMVDSLSGLPLVLDRHGRDDFLDYAYFVRQVELQALAILNEQAQRNGGHYDLERDGLRIQTTLDTALQHLAIKAARVHLRDMQIKLDADLRAHRSRSAWEKGLNRTGDQRWKINARRMRQVFDWRGPWADSISYRDSLWHYERMLHGAVLLMEPQSGRVRAWVGGNDHRFLPFDLVTAPHPIASTIKPFLYTAALEEGMEPCTFLDNEERTYVEYEDWTPQNFDHSSGGKTAMWYALANSLNLPTIDLYFRTGPEAVANTLRALELPVEGVEHPSTALGSQDMDLLQATRAYSAFANAGRLPSTRMIERITDTEGNIIYSAKEPRSDQVLAPETAAQITAMLQRAVEEGTANGLRASGVRSEMAGKTGTAEDYANAWFIAFTPGLVCGTWVGCRDPSVHFHGKAGSGAHLALPIIGRILNTMERSTTMRRQYILPFKWMREYDIDLSCAPTRDPSDVEELMDDVFGPGHRRGHHAPKDTLPPREKKKDGFLQRLFKKKKKKA